MFHSLQGTDKTWKLRSLCLLSIPHCVLRNDLITWFHACVVASGGDFEFSLSLLLRRKATLRKNFARYSSRMNGETSLNLATKKHSAGAIEEDSSEDDDVPLAQRQQKQARDEGPDKKKIKLSSSPSHDVARLHVHSSTKPRPDVNITPYKPHMNVVVKLEHLTPAKQFPSTKDHHSPGSSNATKLTLPVKVLNSKTTADESDDDDDVPLAARTLNKHPVVKVKTESDLNPDKSAKVTKAEKKDKHKNGKPLKAEKKVEKKLKVDDGGKNAVVKKKTEISKPALKKEVENESDDEPLVERVKKTSKKLARSTPSSSNKKLNSSASRKRKKSASDGSESEDEDKPLAKTAKKKAAKQSQKGEVSSSLKKNAKKEVKNDKEDNEEKGKKKKEEEQKDVWKWWEEDQLPEGVKWLHMEHKGPFFPPPYEPLPDKVKFYYDGEHVKLSLEAEEVASFYAKMLDHDYTSKDIFNQNFFEDWRKEMNSEERKLIKDLKKCDFKEMHQYFTEKAEERKNWTKEQKQELKKENEKIINEYGYCLMDGHRQRVGNFKIEPPGLFRGRGDHPKQGKLKKRTVPEEVIINIGKGAKVPDAPEGHKWQKVIHDNKVSWLACWVENIQGSYKYVMLNPTSRVKGEKDWQKYETARKLKDCAQKIRDDYQKDWKQKEMRLRQRGVALYFIDKLALRAGHEKDEDTADTVGCCSLRFEHIKLHEEWEDKEYVVEFDFLGKDSVRYWNFVPVEKKVFKNLDLFMRGKQNGDDLFDRLSTTSLNKYLSELMDGLTAKVFRTYNASMTLQDQLNQLTKPEDNVNAKILTYNRANRAVAILCNHQRTVPKTFEKTMSNLQNKITEKKDAIKDAKKEVKGLRQQLKECKDEKTTKQLEKKKAQVQRLEDQLFKLEVTATDKEENKEIALGTSKLNYLDPRITVAWCKKYEVPVEKAYNKTQREKFAWAIDMADKNFVF